MKKKLLLKYQIIMYNLDEKHDDGFFPWKIKYFINY